MSFRFMLYLRIILLALVFVSIFYYSLHFYILSLEGCPENASMMWCLGNYGQHEVRKLISYLNYSAFLGSLLVFITRQGVYKEIYSYSILLPVYLYLFFIHDTGTDLYHHGGYNRLFFIITFIIFYLFIKLVVYVALSLIKRTIKTIIGILLTIILFYSTYLYIIHGSCDYWSYGFKGTKIDNSNEKCYVPQPEICSFTIFDNILDVPRLSGANCSDHSMYNYDINTIIPF